MNSPAVSILAVALPAQFHDRQPALIAHLSAPLAARFDQRELLVRPSSRSLPRPCLPRRGLQPLDVPRYCLAEIVHQMIPIGDLYRGGCTLSAAVRIQARPIACDDLHSRMGLTPLREAPC